MEINLRYKILDQSLQVESEIAKILSKIIRIQHSESKTLSNKSSAIPFKVKVDLLYDLKRITKEEYNLLTLFMEIRNQLVHNYEVDTMTKVLESINKKQLLFALDSNYSKMYIECTSETEKEHYLNQLLDKLYIELLKILRNQISLIIKDIESEQLHLNNEKLAEGQTAMVKILIETQKEVAEIFVDAFFKEYTNKDEIKNIFEALFYKICKEKVEDKFGKLDV